MKLKKIFNNLWKLETKGFIAVGTWEECLKAFDQIELIRN